MEKTTEKRVKIGALYLGIIEIVVGLLSLASI
jgi:hypothetical protein